MNHLMIQLFFIPGSFIFAQTLEDSIQKGLEKSNALHSASFEWASLNEKLKQSSAGKEIMGTLNGSLSETYSGTSGDYNNSFSNSITATLSKKLYDGGVAKSSEEISSLKIDQKTIQIKILEQNIIPVCCAITHDGDGQLFNTNADTI